MSRGDQNFLHRWSRLKREASVNAVPKQKGSDEISATSPELPPLDSLNFESDFGAFMRAKVDEGVRRAALKKLFSDPRFNVMDGLDVYIDDYSKTEPIPPAMLAGLRQAQNILQWAKEDAEERSRKELEQKAAAREKLGPPAPLAVQPAPEIAAAVPAAPALPQDEGEKPKS
jgi:hypothetical protein